MTTPLTLHRCGPAIQQASAFRFSGNVISAHPRTTFNKFVVSKRIAPKRGCQIKNVWKRHLYVQCQVGVSTNDGWDYEDAYSNVDDKSQKSPSALQRAQQAGDALFSLFDQPRVRALLHVFQFAASLLFVVLYVWSTYSPPATFSLRYNLDVMLCVVFGAEYLWRLKHEVTPVRSIFTFSNLCDLLAFLPPLLELCLQWVNIPFTLGRFDMRWFKLLRGVRVMRLGLMATDYRALHLSSAGTRLLNSAAEVRLFHLVGSVIMLLFCASTVVHVVEQIPWHEALYFVTTTLTTVGYGDVVVRTLLGRMVVLALICVGVVLIPVQAGLVYSQLVNRRMQRGPLPDTLHPTVLVSTRLIEVRGFSDFFSEFFHALKECERLPKNLRMMVMCGNKPSYEFIALQELHEKRITLVEGTPLSEKDLVGSRAERVLGCLLMADRFSTNPVEEDRSIQFQVWAMKSYTKSVPLYVQVLGSASVSRIAPFLDPDKDVIVSLEQTRHRLLVLSCLCPGASTLIGNLLRSADVPPGPPSQRKLAGRYWLRSYVNGCAFKLFKARIGIQLMGHDFVAVCEWMYRESSCVLIGIIGADQKMQLNPQKRRLESGDVAIVIARSQQEAESALLKHYTPPPHSHLASILADRIRLQVSPEEDYFMQPEPHPDTPSPCQPEDYGGEWESESLDDGEYPPCVPKYDEVGGLAASNGGADVGGNITASTRNGGETAATSAAAQGMPNKNGAVESVSSSVEGGTLEQYLNAFARQWPSDGKLGRDPLNTPQPISTNGGNVVQHNQQVDTSVQGMPISSQPPLMSYRDTLMSTVHQQSTSSSHLDSDGPSNGLQQHATESSKSSNSLDAPHTSSGPPPAQGLHLNDTDTGPHTGNNRNGNGTVSYATTNGNGGSAELGDRVVQSAGSTRNSTAISSTTTERSSGVLGGESSVAASEGGTPVAESTPAPLQLLSSSDDYFAELKGHVIVCGAEGSFLKFLKQLRRSYSPNLPVVLLHPTRPEFDRRQLADMGPVYYVQGAPSETASLRAARAFAARALVFLTHPRQRPAMDSSQQTSESYHAARSRAAVLADADAMLTCYGVGEETGMERLHAVVELTFTTSVRFLQPGLLLKGGSFSEAGGDNRRGAPRKSWVMRKKREAAAVSAGLAEWQANPYYCAGRISVPAMMDTFACQCFFNRGMLVQLMEELMGDDGRTGGAMLRQIHLPDGMSGKTYGELFLRLVMGRHIIPLGLFRRKRENPSGRLYYVMTNPRAEEILEATDRVFVLRQQHIAWMSDDHDDDDSAD